MGLIFIHEEIMGVLDFLAFQTRDVTKVFPTKVATDMEHG
jgi:hypothetical protein